MSSKKNIANAMSGKTARACDCCIRKRARWYCAADDAFLCQVCDGTVHSANSLARRHERVRLNTSSLKRSNQDSDRLPSWHRGLTKKPRTPRRNGKHSSKSQHNMGQNPLHIVPDLGVEDTMSISSSQEGETEEQLLYRVPTYDPLVGELCTSTTSTPPVELEGSSSVLRSNHHYIKSPPDGYLPSDLDLEDFATDVDTLLGRGLDEESYGIEELGLLDCSPNNNHNNDIRDDDQIIEFSKEVKAEDELCYGGEIIKGCEIEVENDIVGFREPFEFSFDYEHDFPTICEGINQEEHHKVMMVESSVVNGGGDNDHELCKLEGDFVKDEIEVMLINKRRKILLRLDYDAISDAWASQGSPWMNGQRPDIKPEDCWPHCMGTCGTNAHHSLFGDNLIRGIGGNGRGDGGREARVSRYREKRRTRLFSKKIRYEVRKLNAEKRPRMKGRFVKRSSFTPTTTAFPLLSK